MLNVLLFFSTYVSGFYASIYKNAAYAFVLYEAIYFFNPQMRWWGYIVPNISYSYTIVVLMTILFLSKRKEYLVNNLLMVPQFKWMYAVLFFYAAAYFTAVFPESHVQFTIYFLKLIFIVSVAYKICDTEKKLDLAIYGYIFGSWYISFLAFQTGRNSGARVEGIGTVDAPDANDIAAAIAPCLVFCIYYFWVSKKIWVKCLFAIAGIFLANALILINSRGAFLGVAASILYFMIYMYFSFFQRKFQKSIAIFITIAGLSGAASLMDEGFYNRISSMSSTEVNEEQESGSTRVVFWAAAWEMAKDFPFGTGHLGFNHFSPIYIPENVHTGGSRHRAVHSTWFEALSEAGYLGLISFIFMITATFSSLKASKKAIRKLGTVDPYFKMIAIEAALLSFIIAMSFLNRMRAEVLYWFILYAACAYNIYVLKPRKISIEKNIPAIKKKLA